MKLNLPWKVNFVRHSKRGSYTLWIEDSTGYEVFPWMAFDDGNEGITKQLAKAKLVVKAVNAYGRKPK